MAKIPTPIGTEINLGDSTCAAIRYMVTAEQAPAVFRKLASPARFFLNAEASVRDERNNRTSMGVAFKVPRASALEFIKEACTNGCRISITIYKESPHLAFIG